MTLDSTIFTASDISDVEQPFLYAQKMIRTVIGRNICNCLYINFIFVIKASIGNILWCLKLLLLGNRHSRGKDFIALIYLFFLNTFMFHLSKRKSIWRVTVITGITGRIFFRLLHVWVISFNGAVNETEETPVLERNSNCGSTAGWKNLPLHLLLGRKSRIS